MKRWKTCRAWLIPGRCWPPRRWNFRPVLASQPLSLVDSHSRFASTYGYRPLAAFRSSVFNKTSRPTDVAAWTSLLDGALPAHLRLSDGPSTVPLDAVELAEVLLAAQYPGNSFFNKDGTDLLFHLGFNQGRWDAVVWLVKRLVEKFPFRQTTSERMPDIAQHWSSKLSLREETVAPIRLGVSPANRQLVSHSLDELTFGPFETGRQEHIIRHNALGQIWRSLGAMTQACAGGDVRSEVLELIAYIHHHGFMPEAIYRYNAHPDRTVTQQPPLLFLLSSRILTSLSDAAWRAHERNAIQEARSRGGDEAALPLELASSSYRINVAGLRSEVWMELILWSSFHGGWILPGIAILRALISDKSKPMWKPISWREYEDQLTLPNKPTAEDWDDLDYIFKTRDVSDMLDSTAPSLQIDRTVSAEVVNAYIEALVNNVSVGVGERGILTEQVISQLHQFQAFLGRSKLSMSNGTWDALIVRLMEYDESLPEQNFGSLQNLIALSSGLGQGLQSTNSSDFPAHVLDGNMAIHGLLHRALKSQIIAGNLEGAMNVFRTLQQRTDDQRRKSLGSFMMRRSSSLLAQTDPSSMFTSNFPGIDYPALGMQIPPMILGQFLDLVTQAEAYEFGRWLLYSQDVDGAVIAPWQYKIPTVQAAVVRFAAMTDDQALLSLFKGSAISLDTLRAMFDSQVGVRRWKAAARVLNHLTSLQAVTWSIANLANLSATIIQCSSGLQVGRDDQSTDIQRARIIFSDMVREKYDTRRPRLRKHSIQTLLWVLSTINAEWAGYCAGLQQHHGPVSFSLGTTAFNTILNAVAEANGSAEAMRILDTFWPQSVRDIFRSRGSYTDGSGRRRMPRSRLDAMKAIQHHRIVLRPSQVSGQSEDVVLLGALDALPSTVLIVFQKAIQEAGKARSESSDRALHSAPYDVVLWTLQRFKEMRLNDLIILRQIDDALSEQGMFDVKGRFPVLFGRAVEEDQRWKEDVDETFQKNRETKNSSV